MDNFLFQKRNLACNWRMAQIQKKKKNVRPGLEKNTLQKTFFTSVLTIAREIPKKIKGKNPDKMCYDLSENTPTATERMTQKVSLYLLGMSNRIFKFIFKTSQYPFVVSLC